MCKIKNIFRILFLFLIVFILNGCSSLLLNPKGSIAKEEYSLIIISFIGMLFVVVPVIFMTLYFSFKYRISNKKQIYKPDWSDSFTIEIIVWAIPVFIIFLLACMTWNYTHKLEPSNPLLSQKKPIEINVVALDWKWLFIYPKYHIATINKIVFPVNTPILFHITSNSVMNSFFIPSLGTQIYAMPGMVTTLNLIANYSGHYKGISSNYSGIGFSNMKFTAEVVENNQYFINWIKELNASPKVLKNMQDFLLISKPSEKYSIEYFSHVNINLFDSIIKKFNI